MAIWQTLLTVVPNASSHQARPSESTIGEAAKICKVSPKLEHKLVTLLGGFNAPREPRDERRESRSEARMGASANAHKPLLVHAILNEKH